MSVGDAAGQAERSPSAFRSPPRSRTKRSAGLRLYRESPAGLEVLLVHPGGRYGVGKDAAAWSIPKGEFGPEETRLAAARREFTEETGGAVDGDFLALAPVRQRSGRIAHAFSVNGRSTPRR